MAATVFVDELAPYSFIATIASHTWTTGGAPQQASQRKRHALLKEASMPASPPRSNVICVKRCQKFGRRHVGMADF